MALLEEYNVLAITMTKSSTVSLYWLTPVAIQTDANNYVTMNVKQHVLDRD